MTRNTKQGSAASDLPFIYTDEAMQLAGCSRATLARWIADDLFTSYRPIAAGSGRRRIDRASYLAFLRGEVAGAGA